MVEAYFEWKATAYFVTLAITAIIVGAYIFFWILIWFYQKLCQARKRRLERLQVLYEDKTERESDECFAQKYNTGSDADGSGKTEQVQEE